MVTSEPTKGRALWSDHHRLGMWVMVETALVVGHCAHGAHVYDDPSRYHVVAPAVLALVAAWCAIHWNARAGSPFSRLTLAVVVGVPFVLVFGVYHGAFQHVLKLIAFAHGASPEHLQDVFDSPDFAVPNDPMFEASGVATLFAAVWVTRYLLRVVRKGHSDLPAAQTARMSVGEG